MRTLSVESLQVAWRGQTCVQDLSFQVQSGELLALIGPNGAGKSTVLRALAQLLPHQGRVLLDGEDLARLAPHQRARRLAYLAQGDQVVWPLQVRDFVALGRLPHQGRWRLASASKADQNAVDAALSAMHLTDMAERHLHALSGGERARARLARAMAVQAPLLLADEPVAALDPYHQLSVMELLRAQCNAGHAVVVVLHDLTLASRFCDRVLLLQGGRAVACGAPRHVLTPAHLQRVYQVQAMHGEHESQGYVLPWRCRPGTEPSGAGVR
ncbi:ABC transporter ATP-binding protein [Comamonas aquatica]|uniref:ABC transporter ATP-binding protein n=1 Tax=Comamonas aquatica TaxID=225991 RepID=A0AA42W2K8_9BURK|nr:ABC transporter ATP-binding protein [Comamonas aquatica]MDH0900138.1 ABC transporter ATP-binding protein [Comamonas aquatica]MDH1428360.1 ABC transporter ATP-binding protein [Comamonas aquatica]MDH1605213.1 ABC transporter ATP-binding protein [Comamonas aquatica]MDH1617325.1 ABC transporter ATP-binding protein [Comamonas aquatica]MDH2005084.1 ABC transporter ATP-binding protein [Comamonas aquatica]